MKFDSQNMLGSIEVLDKQCLDAWQAIKKINLPKGYQQINKVVLFGMGGSMLGIDVIKNLFFKELKVPVFIVNDYLMPAYIDKNTLAVLSSYSGTTEETLKIAGEIKKRTKKIFVITTGGNLKKYAKKNKLPAYIIDPKFNPCGQPRMAVGYSIIAQLGLFNKLKLIKIQDKDIQSIVLFLEKNNGNARKQALSAVKKIINKIIVFVASEFLLGNAHAISNQTNENGKNFAAYFAIPELNHHLMEGLGHPKSNSRNLFFIFLNSSLYYSRNKKRYEVTQAILDKNNVSFYEFRPKAKNKILQSFEVMQWGSYLSYFLSQANNIDPSPIPWVDYFKNALKK